jgi:hypothetical protein
MIKRSHCLILALAVIALTHLYCAGAPQLASAHRTVVVELFTAEGCSSCPPADELLGRLSKQTFPDGLEVIPLGLHVDYWNAQGWRDRFSSADYTERQERYAQRFHLPDVYTPQMVIEGSVAVTGNDVPAVLHAVSEAAQRPQLTEVQLSTSEGGLKVTVKSGQSNAATVMLALTEDNVTSKVNAGENSGRELHHSAVVRKLQTLGRLREGNFETAVRLSIAKDWKREDMRVVVFVQDSSRGEISGAATTGFPLP